MQDEPGVVARVDGRIGVIELARPAGRNALRPEDRVAMLAALRAFEEGLRLAAEARGVLSGADAAEGLAAFAARRKREFG